MGSFGRRSAHQRPPCLTAGASSLPRQQLRRTVQDRSLQPPGPFSSKLPSENHVARKTRSVVSVAPPYNYPRNASSAKASCSVAVLNYLMSLRRIPGTEVSSSTLFVE